MIVPAQDRAVSCSPGQETVRFGLSDGDAAHIMGVLRDAIYSDKVVAVLREYGANAQDAHRDPAASAGSRGRPIRVRLPTIAEPTLEVTDWGPGLSPEDVARVFTQYGASTKRGQAEATGYIGVGCKAGFAYSDSFAVTSRHGGRARTYAAALDPSDRGEMRLVDDQPCEPGDSGLTVRVPVRTGDVAEFRQKAAQVFRFYDPPPDVEVPLPDGRCDFVEVGSDPEWVAVMGYVAYPVDVEQVEVPSYVAQVGGVVRFPLGALSVSASREALRYDDRTKAALGDGLCRVVDEHAAALVRGTAGLDDWGRRLRFRSMSLFAPLLRAVSFPGVFDNDVAVDPKRAADGESSRAGKAPPVDAGPPRVRLSSKTVVVHPRTRLVFVDDHRAVAGYGLGSGDVVVRRGTGATHAEAWDALQALVASHRLGGIPVIRTSSLEWVRPASGRGSSGGGPRHRAAVLVLREGYEPKKGDPPSAGWEPVTREAQEDDLRVDLDHFRPPPGFWGRVATVRQVLRAFGAEHPPVYGYRLTKATAQDAGRGVGTPYAEWAVSGVYDLVAAACPQVDDLLRALPWERTVCDAKKARAVAAALGPAHPVALLVASAAGARAALERAGWARREATGDLVRLMGRSEAPDLSALAPYPLLARQGFGKLLFSDQADDWLEYVRALDALRAVSMEHPCACCASNDHTPPQSGQETIP